MIEIKPGQSLITLHKETGLADAASAGKRRHWRRPLAAAALCTMLTLSLQGCFGVLAGGLLAGTFAASDRRTLGAQTEDKAIVVKGETNVSSALPDGAHVNVTSFNRKVLLSGEVPDQASKVRAEREINNIAGVEHVFNELAISGSSSFSSRSSDALITSKVLASLVDSKELYANAFKITTERGIVYLLGRVTQREGQIGAKIASGVSGVQKVVTLYDYLSEEEAKQLSQQPRSSAQ